METPGAPGGIAIIGLSGRYPQADSLQAFWQNLIEGRNCIGEVPAARWDHSRYFDPVKGKPGKAYSKWGGFISGIDEFDPVFFRISPAEAERMDPQERLFLQAAYASIEDAGYTAPTLCDGARVGVYVGVMNSLYCRQSTNWSIANRVSYLLDLHGPSMAVDTACSSSLTAIHQAVEALRSGTCGCAIAGGVNLIVDPIQYTNLSAMTMLSSDDCCRSFGERSDGFVDGEGVGAVVLKPLDCAISANDHIYGVILASAINCGGKTNGYTVPNPNAQCELVCAALAQGQIDPRTISYIEAHGTGTALGDPIEVAGLTQAFARMTQGLPPQAGPARQYCAIGSVKSNIGHLESAAGMAGLTKVLLQMQHGMLAPSLHSRVLNPNIDFARTPFHVQQAAAEWRRPIVTTSAGEREHPRRAGISSFGAGGANAHLIIEEYVAPMRRSAAVVGTSATRPVLVVLSARTEQSLLQRAVLLLDYLDRAAPTTDDLLNIAYTMQVGREAFEHRAAFVAHSVEQLRDGLRNFRAADALDTEGRHYGDVKQHQELLASLTADPGFDAIVQSWLRLGKFDRVLDLWVKGLSLDWPALYGAAGPWAGSSPWRVSLPTYPFARTRCWLRGPGTGPEPAGVEEASGRVVDIGLSDTLDAVMAGRLEIAVAAERARSILQRRAG